MRVRNPLSACYAPEGRTYDLPFSRLLHNGNYAKRLWRKFHRQTELARECLAFGHLPGAYEIFRDRDMLQMMPAIFAATPVLASGAGRPNILSLTVWRRGIQSWLLVT